MTDWIEQVATKMEHNKSRKDKEIENLKFQRELLKEEASKTFGLLRDVVAKDIEKINKRFSTYDRKLDPLEHIGDRQFRVARRYSPFYLLTVTFDAMALRIDYTVETPSLSDGNLYESRRGKFGFLLCADGKASLVTESTALFLQDISEELLMPALGICEV